MDFAKPISQNLKKFVKSLQSRKERDIRSMFVAEGIKLCRELLTSNYRVEFIVVSGGAGDIVTTLAHEFNRKKIPVYAARKKEFEQIADTKSPQDILAVVNIKAMNTDFTRPFIALDGVNDPGNLGTIIRTADWFGFRHIITGGGAVDTFNPKVVRSSMGSLLRCVVTRADNLKEYIAENYPSFAIYGATLDAGTKMEEIRPDGRFGIILGSEAHGISEEIKSILTSEFIIEGHGDAESLNVAVSAGIIAFHFSKFLGN